MQQIVFSRFDDAKCSFTLFQVSVEQSDHGAVMLVYHPIFQIISLTMLIRR